MQTKLENFNGIILWSKSSIYTPIIIEKAGHGILLQQECDIVEIEISNVKELIRILQGLIKES